MESLVAQPGEPILSFGAPDGGKVPVEQRRFFLSPSIKPDPETEDGLCRCASRAACGGQDCELLTPETTSLKAPSAGLFFANASGKGYYRTAYPPAQYATLVAHVETGLTPAERISLAGDEWAQVRANKATVGDYLNLVAALKADPNAEVLSNAIGGVSTIYDNVASTS